MAFYTDAQPQKCPLCGGDGELRDSGECVIDNGNTFHSGTITFHCDACGERRELSYNGEEYRQDIYAVLEPTQMYKQHLQDFYKTVGGELVGSIIYCDEDNGVCPNTHWIVVFPVDGGLFTIGYLDHANFDAAFAKALLDAAVEAAHTYEWWVQNGAAWFDAQTGATMMYQVAVRHGRGSQRSDYYKVGRVFSDIDNARDFGKVYADDHPEHDGWFRDVVILDLDDEDNVIQVIR